MRQALQTGIRQWEQEHRRCPQCGSEQVVLADGATWIKKEAQKHFAEATCILDWPHLWRTMIKAVRAVARSREADPTWVREQSKQLSERLWKGEVDPAKAILRG